MMQVRALTQARSLRLLQLLASIAGVLHRIESWMLVSSLFLCRDGYPNPSVPPPPS